MASERPTFLSMSLVSNRPKEFMGLLDNIEETAYDPKRIEVIVRIDEGDEPMQALVREEEKHRDLKLKHLSVPYTGFLDLYKSFDEMHYKLCDPNAYFVQHAFDEIRYKTPHWDKILEERYTGLFPDNIYRLRTSMYKLWHYYHIAEVAPHPENSPITTKRWVDLTGWCPCHSADSFQQMLVYYLGIAADGGDRFYRDIPIFDVELGGLEAGVGLQTPEEEAAYQQRARDAWAILFSDTMQIKAQEKANILRAHLKAAKMRKNAIFVANTGLSTHVFDADTQQEIMKFPILPPISLSSPSSAAAPAPIHANRGRAVPLCIHTVQFAHRVVNSGKRIVKKLLGH